MITARYLSQIAVIAELGSISRAAEHLRITQPTLSRTVKIVEDTVGSRIFRRDRQGVVPTEIGLRLVAEGRAILDHTRTARETVEDWKGGVSGRLRLGTGPMLATTFADELVIAAVQKPWPYALSVVVRPAPDLLSELANGSLDVVLAPSRLAAPAQNLHHEVVFDDTLCVYGSEADPLATEAHLDPSDLRGPWVDFSLLTGLMNPTEHLLETLGLDHIRPSLRVAGDITMGMAMVSRLNGYCFLPTRAEKRLAKDWGLRRMPVSVPAATLEIAMWTNARNNDSPAIQHFRTELRKASSV